MPKKILVCLDGSDLAEQILPHAIEQAKRFRSQVLLVEVVDTTPMWADTGTPSVAAYTPQIVEMIEQSKVDARAYLARVAKSLQEKNLRVDFAVLEGSAGSSIVRYAEENEVDLIAIATHGRSGLGRLVFGSVADHVLRESARPILLIKPRKVE